MLPIAGLPVLKVRMQHERHVVHARQRARELAERLGFDRQMQVRLATGTSELARNAFRYAGGGEVSFEVVLSRPQALVVTVTDRGPGIPHLASVMDGTYVSRTGMGKGLQGTQRLMDRFDIDTGDEGTRVRIVKFLPATAPEATAESVQEIASRITASDVDSFNEVERQNQELLRTLEELREKQDQLAQMNAELEDTNRGVVALYAELEQNASDLRRVSELKTSFLSNLSHEFRTPLNAILGLCRILFDRADGDLTPEQEKQLSYIQRSATDLNELVNDLLDLAKVEAGKIDIRPRVFRVADLFAAQRGMLRSLLVSKAVELTFAAPDDLPELFTDEQKVSQILRNLISNALKFTVQGSVRVKAALQGAAIVFAVSDDGIGIALDDQERIFQEFEQVESEIQARVRGTGLGLPLARRLARLLGGDLTVSSTVGQGSTFTTILPVQFSTDNAAPVPMSRPSAAETSVLIVEDNPETRFIHEAALKRSGAVLAFARNLPEARAAMALRQPKVLVLDRWLEGEDALPFVEALRADGFRGGLIVVSVNEDAAGPLRAGANAFFRKPVDPVQLRNKVMELLLSRTGPTVLLVDDDEINRYLLCEVLGRYHFRIVEARSGREALVAAAEEHPLLIFLDVAMPGFTGLETLRELKEGAATSQIPVVVHTSKDLSGEELALIARFEALQFSKQQLAAQDAPAALHAVLQEAGLV